MSGQDEEETLWIESVRDPDGQPVCMLTWGPLQWPAAVADVRATALDMIACAAYAEMTMLLVAKLKLPGNAASAFITSLLDGAGRKAFGSASTVGLLPAGSTKTGTAVVLLSRGGQRGVVMAGEARSMASQWLEAAEATESDRLLAEALRATGAGDSQKEKVFVYLRELRKERP